MEKYNVVNVTRDDERVIIHEVDTGEGTPRTFKYTAIWGGLKWPAGNFPAYYCILGQTVEKDYSDRYIAGKSGPLRFFAEHQGKMVLKPDKFFLKLTDDISKFGCDEIYTTTGDEWSCYTCLLEDYEKDKQLNPVFLQDAPFIDDFGQRLALITTWMNKGTLDLPVNSIAREQLKSLTEDDLESEDLGDRLYAVSALGFAVGAFQKHSPRPIPPEIMARILRDRGRRPGGFMAR